MMDQRCQPVAGRKSRLVLLQGQASSPDWWTDLRGRYEDRLRTATMDYRGTGSTFSPDADLSTRLLGEDAIAVLDTLSVNRAHGPGLRGPSCGSQVR